jgi:hypothetical protein
VTELLLRVVVPSRLALIYRKGEMLGYNPGRNMWEHLEEDTAEVLRWLRAERNRTERQGFWRPGLNILTK